MAGRKVDKSELPTMHRSVRGDRQERIVLLRLHLDAADRSRILANVAEVGMMQADGDKLRLLAEWFDLKYPNDKNPEVQKDLRRIADNLDSMRKCDGPSNA